MGTIYGMPSLRRHGAAAHDFFAAVKPAKRFVSLYLKPLYGEPGLVDESSPAIRRRRSGRTAINVDSLDDELLAELESLVARSFEAYVAQHGSNAAAAEAEGRR
jgi:hypothetical protein